MELDQGDGHRTMAPDYIPDVLLDEYEQAASDQVRLATVMTEPEPHTREEARTTPPLGRSSRLIASGVAGVLVTSFTLALVTRSSLAIVAAVNCWVAAFVLGGGILAYRLVRNAEWFRNVWANDEVDD